MRYEQAKRDIKERTYSLKVSASENSSTESKIQSCKIKMFVNIKSKHFIAVTFTASACIVLFFGNNFKAFRKDFPRPNFSLNLDNYELTFSSLFHNDSLISFIQSKNPVPAAADSQRALKKKVLQLHTLEDSTTNEDVEIWRNETCILFDPPSVYKLGDNLRNKSLIPDPNVCKGTTFTEITKSGQLVIVKQEGRNTTCCLMTRVKAPIDPKKPKLNNIK